jgi:hypothetical protein
MTMIPINAVVTVDCAEGNESVGTQWQDTFIVPLDMTLRDALKQMFGDDIAMPKGRVCLTVPATLPPIQQS